MSNPNPNPNPNKSILFNNIINSAFGSACAEFITLPICTIRTNYINQLSQNQLGPKQLSQNQLGPKQLSQNQPSLNMIIRDYYSKYGIAGFFSAKYPAIFSQAITTSSRYTLYKILPQYNPLNSKHNEMTKNNQTNKSFMTYLFNASNSVSAGIITSIITHPIDYLKINKQMNNHNINIKHIYRGYTKTLSKVIVGGSTFFPLYDLVKSYEYSSTTSGVISAILSTTIMQPFDYLKTRNIYGLNHNVSHIIRSPKEILILFRGLNLNLLRVVPHYTLTMSIIDYLNN
jgi:hypothetical protein